MINKSKWNYEQTESVETGLDKYVYNVSDNTPIAWCYDNEYASIISLLPEMLDCLIGLFIESKSNYDSDRPYLENCWRNYYKKEIGIIESATGKSIDEVIE